MITSLEQVGVECERCHEQIFSNSRRDEVVCNCGAITISGGFDYNEQTWEESPGLEIKRTVYFPLDPSFRNGQPRRPWSDKRIAQWKAEHQLSSMHPISIKNEKSELS